MFDLWLIHVDLPNPCNGDKGYAFDASFFGDITPDFSNSNKPKYVGWKGLADLGASKDSIISASDLVAAQKARPLNGMYSLFLDLTGMLGLRGPLKRKYKLPELIELTQEAEACSGLVIKPEQMSYRLNRVKKVVAEEQNVLGEGAEESLQSKVSNGDSTSQNQETGLRPEGAEMVSNGDSTSQNQETGLRPEGNVAPRATLLKTTHAESAKPQVVNPATQAQTPASQTEVIKQQGQGDVQQTMRGEAGTTTGIAASTKTTAATKTEVLDKSQTEAEPQEQPALEQEAVKATKPQRKAEESNLDKVYRDVERALKGRF